MKPIITGFTPSDCEKRVPHAAQIPSVNFFSTSQCSSVNLYLFVSTSILKVLSSVVDFNEATRLYTRIIKNFAKEVEFFSKNPLHNTAVKLLMLSH